MDDIKYKIDFTHLFSSRKQTITLANSKLDSVKMLKEIKKRFFWWKRSVIYC